jgi:dolichyl-phosphate-mannose--protein O-mannosyl transferase
MNRIRAKQSLKPFHETTFEWSDDSEPLSIPQVFNRPRFLHPSDLASLLILVVSLATHLYRLDQPSAVCFDETFFGNFTGQYFRRQHFIDIHPPLGKLVLFAGALIAGYNDSLQFTDETIGRDYPNDSYVGVRAVNALLSSFCPVLLYFTLRATGLSVTSSVVSSLMMAFEDSMIVEGRFILTDGILHCFVVLSLLALSLAVRYPGWKSLVFCGISFGLAISTKQTSWSLFAVAFCALFVGQLRFVTNGRLSLKFLFSVCWRVGFISLLSFGVLLAVFFVHIKVLSEPGEVSILVCPEMYPRRVEIWRDVCLHFGFFKQFFRLIKEMHATNMKVLGEDQLSSYWWEWPLMTSVPITFFWRENSTVRLHIQPFNGFFCLANAVVFVLLCFFIGLSSQSGLDNEREVLLQGVVFLFGFLSSLLPFALVPRILYLYHYIVPLVFLIGLVAFTLELLHLKHRKMALLADAMIVFASFCSFWKYRFWIYGLPLADQHSLMVWPSWQQPAHFDDG